MIEQERKTRDLSDEKEINEKKLYMLNNQLGGLQPAQLENIEKNISKLQNETETLKQDLQEEESRRDKIRADIA